MTSVLSYHQNKEVVFLVIGSLPWLGIHGVYVNSSIVDEGPLVKASPLQGWWPIHSNWTPP